jgi:hypothetical protein
VRTTFVVMAYPVLEQSSQMGIREGNHKIEHFSPERPEYPLTDRISHGCPHGCLEDIEAQMTYALVEGP